MKFPADSGNGLVRSFEVGPYHFLLDGDPVEIRCGEIHFARVPREYWRHRVRLCRAMGLNAVCVYLFWNFHEFTPGAYDWSGQADARAFCQIAQEENLWVLLRPGPYVCAEWDGGGLPWWLLKEPDIKLRSLDPTFMAAAKSWLMEVGRMLAPLQVTRGGPILMVQVENEYGSYGSDVAYMNQLRSITAEAGFDVALFACNQTADLPKGFVSELFQAVNFSDGVDDAFSALRALQPGGPLMCGEFYSGWFDTWGAKHSAGSSARYFANLERMLDKSASFSIYMAHGGTSFGLWSGANRPFRPDTSSYDYDAPISEAGWIGEKFRRTRHLLASRLEPGEELPEPPPPNPTQSIPEFTLSEAAALFDNLPPPSPGGELRSMEALDQGHGCCLYRKTAPPGGPGRLRLGAVHDFGWVYLDGVLVGVLDRRSRRFSVALPARKTPARLDILVEAMGHVNFGVEAHDRKGLFGPVELISEDGAAEALAGPWRIFPMRLDEAAMSELKWSSSAPQGPTPAFWRGRFTVDRCDDTFLDLRFWGKGVVWLNGRCLSRYWNIGPTQTAYLPGPWLRSGENEVVILDLIGPATPRLAGLTTPILDELRPDLDFVKNSDDRLALKLSLAALADDGEFAPGADAQVAYFDAPRLGRQFCLEALSSQDGRPFAAIAELELLDAQGRSISREAWTIALVDSEETAAEDGAGLNAIDGQSSSFWHTAWSSHKPDFPHQIVVDLGATTELSGFRYLPRQGNRSGRIKKYRAYVGDLVELKR
jgi:beta-galactosidase